MQPLLLNLPHTHAGKHYRRGDRLDVDSETAQWLITNGIASREPTPVRIKTDLSPPQRKEPNE